MAASKLADKRLPYLTRMQYQSLTQDRFFLDITSDRRDVFGFPHSSVVFGEEVYESLRHGFAEKGHGVASVRSADVRLLFGLSSTAARSTLGDFLTAN